MFDQAQIQEFKEAFNMIDQNRDGFIDKEDLADMLASLGNFVICLNVQELQNFTRKIHQNNTGIKFAITH
jgi:Ca2+-binding EF-hand superfamily protein